MFWTKISWGLSTTSRLGYSQAHFNRLSTGCQQLASLKYRRNFLMERFEPLSDFPDWSFADGRQRALNPQEKQKKIEQMELAREIVSGLKEQREAKEEFQRHLLRSAELKTTVLSRKPKAKGSRLASAAPLTDPIQ